MANGAAEYGMAQGFLQAGQRLSDKEQAGKAAEAQRKQELEDIKMRQQHEVNLKKMALKWEEQKALMSFKLEFEQELRDRQYEFDKINAAKEFEIDMLRTRAEIDFNMKEKARVDNMTRIQVKQEQLKKEVSEGRIAPDDPKFLDTMSKLNNRMTELDFGIDYSDAAEQSGYGNTVEPNIGTTPWWAEYSKERYQGTNEYEMAHKYIENQERSAPSYKDILAEMEAKQQVQAYSGAWDTNDLAELGLTKEGVINGVPDFTRPIISGTLKKLDTATAESILQETGGDKNKARELARQRGYEF